MASFIEIPTYKNVAREICVNGRTADGRTDVRPKNIMLPIIVGGGIKINVEAQGSARAPMPRIDSDTLDIFLATTLDLQARSIIVRVRPDVQYST